MPEYALDAVMARVEEEHEGQGDGSFVQVGPTWTDPSLLLARRGVSPSPTACSVLSEQCRFPASTRPALRLPVAACLPVWLCRTRPTPRLWRRCLPAETMVSCRLPTPGLCLPTELSACPVARLLPISLLPPSLPLPLLAPQTSSSCCGSSCLPTATSGPAAPMDLMTTSRRAWAASRGRPQTMGGCITTTATGSHRQLRRQRRRRRPGWTGSERAHGRAQPPVACLPPIFAWPLGTHAGCCSPVPAQCQLAPRHDTMRRLLLPPVKTLSFAPVSSAVPPPVTPS